MYRLELHPDAEADLDYLWETGPDGAADVSVLIQELAGDEEKLRAMRIHQREEGRLHFSRLLKYHIWGRNLWRAKIAELEDEECVLAYRLIYGFTMETSVNYLLAVMHRNTGYEKNLLFVERIRRACRELGIPGLPGRESH